MSNVLFRFHRGSLAASMDTIVPIHDFNHLVATVRQNASKISPLLGNGVTCDTVWVERYCFDKRTGWDTYIVTVKGHAVGFTNGPVPKGSE